MRTIHKTVKFADLFESHAVRFESQKVRRNTADDFNLGPQFVFACGEWVDNPSTGKREWCTAWVKPNEATSDAIRPSMINGSIGSHCGGIGAVRLFHVKGMVRAVANDRHHIGSVIVAEEVTDIPTEVLALVGE